MKSSVGDLAVFGGPPAFDAPLHVGLPDIGDRAALIDRINDALDRRWFTNDGPLVREFEQRVADYLGVRRCVAVCNGTTALQIAVRALGLTGEVIVPSFTFVATAHALQWQGVTPVFCDIDRATHTIDPAKVEELITPTDVVRAICDVVRFSVEHAPVIARRLSGIDHAHASDGRRW